MTNEQTETRKYTPPRIEGATGIRLILQLTVLSLHFFKYNSSWCIPDGNLVGSLVVGVFYLLSGYTTYSSIASLDLSSPTPLRLIQIWVEFLAKRMIPIYILVHLVGFLSQHMYGQRGELSDAYTIFYDWGFPYSFFVSPLAVNGPLWYLGPQFLFWIIGPPIVMLLLIVMSRIRDIKVPCISKFQVFQSIVPAVMPVTFLMLVFSRAWFVNHTEPSTVHLLWPEFRTDQPMYKIQNRILPYLFGIGTAHLVDAVFRYRFESESKSDLDLVLPNEQTGKDDASTNLGPLSAKSTAQGVLQKFGALILSGGWIVEIAVVISFYCFISDMYWVVCIAPVFACFCVFCLSTPGASSSILTRLVNSRLAARSCSGSISLTAYVVHGAVMGYNVKDGLRKHVSAPAGLIWIFTIAVMCDRYVVDVSRKWVTSALRYLESAVKLAASYLTRDEIYKYENIILLD